LKSYRILFDIRHYNGCIEIQANDADEAEKKFDQIPCEQLLAHTNDVAAEIESVVAVQCG